MAIEIFEYGNVKKMFKEVIRFSLKIKKFSNEKGRKEKKNKKNMINLRDLAVF